MDRFHKKKYKSEFPECIKLFLIFAGYSEWASLQNINEEDIRRVENRINKKNDGNMILKQQLIGQLKCCYSVEYRQMLGSTAVFEFLPGHHPVILNIPAIIKDYAEAESQILPKNSEEKVRNQLLKLLRRTLVTAARAHNRTNVDESMISEQNLEISRKNIPQHDGPHEEAPIYRGCFMCPYCDKKINLKYARFWFSGKVTKHIKNHLSGPSSRL